MEGVSILELEKWVDKKRKRMKAGLYGDKSYLHFSAWMHVYGDIQSMVRESDSDIIPFSSSVFVWEDIESLGPPKHRKGNDKMNTNYGWDVIIRIGKERRVVDYTKWYAHRDDYPIEIAAQKDFAKDFAKFLKRKYNMSCLWNSPIFKVLAYIAVVSTILGLSVNDFTKWIK